METRDILEEIYPRIFERADFAFSDLQFKRRGENWISPFKLDGTPPREKRPDKTVITAKVSHRLLEQGGESLSFWDYIQRRENLTNGETLKELARIADYTLPDTKDILYEEIEKRKERENILESALGYFLSEKAGAQAYLTERGFTLEEIEASEIGFYPSQEGLREHLRERGYSEDAINKTGLFVYGMGRTNNLSIPYRDATGRLIGFTFRDTTGNVEEKYKYLGNEGLKKDSPFNLNEGRGEKTFIIVEGFIDAILATLRGIKGVLAIGGSSLTETQIDTALRYGAKDFILALDNDEAGREGTERALRLIHEKGGRAYVMPYPDKPYYKDPDELLRGEGIEDFQGRLQRALSGVSYKAQTLRKKYGELLKTDKGIQEYLDEALSYEETIVDPIDAKSFIESICSELWITPEDLEPRIKTYHEKKARETAERGYRALSKDIQRLLDEGKAQDIGRLIEERKRELRAQSISQIVRPYTLKDLLEDLKKTPTGLKTGYEKLDRLLVIPQEAITIIAGRPSHGKTTLLQNLLINMTELYEDRTFIFFSYEETKKKIGTKIINILSGHTFENDKNTSALESYLKSGSTKAGAVEAGQAKFFDLTEGGRLLIIDEHYYVDELSQTIASLSEKYNIGAVFIDYIQKIKNRGKFPTRQAELQDTSSQILETAKDYSLPVILGAQFNRLSEGRTDNFPKLSELREAGDIEQDANLVIGLYNEAMQKKEDGGDRISSPIIDLKLRILKNRDGAGTDEPDIILKFNRPVLKIEEGKIKVKTWSEVGT